MERINSIVKDLGSRKGYVSISELAEAFDVTQRTIRNDLKQLEEHLDKTGLKLEKDRKLGIRLSRNGMSQTEINELIRKINDDRDYYSSDEREKIIIEKLLFAKQPVTLKELEELTLTSRTSLQKNLIECEKRLNSWSISLKKTQHVGLSLETDEYAWRNAVLNHIITKNRNADFRQLYTNLIEGKKDWLSSISSRYIKDIFTDVNTVFVVNFIRRYESINKIRFTDNAFVTIFLFLCITLSENKKNNIIEESNFPIGNFYGRDVLNKLIDESVAFINNGSDVKLNRNELEAILIFLLSQKRVNDENYSGEAFLLNDKGFLNKSYLIVKSFIRSIDEYLNTNLSDDSKLFDNLLLHIRPTIYRLLFGIVLDNPLVDNIRDAFPEVFAACKFASKAITEETNSSISDSEISYLALHVQASIEKKSETRFNGLYKTLIICPEGVGTSTILYYKLLNSIPNLVIDKICSIDEYNQIDKDKVDLVISTVPISTEKRSNVVVVNPLLYDEDVSKIRQVMRKVSIFKNISNVDIMVDDIITIISRYATISDYQGLEHAIGNYFDNTYAERKNKKPSLTTFLDEDFILLKQKAESWQDAFSQAGQILLEQKYITQAYIQSAIEAVKTYGPYMFIGKGVAMMHAGSSDGVKKTGFGFVTLDHPVYLDFEDKLYEIDMIIIFSATEGLEHLQALGELIEITGDSSKVEQLLKMDDKKEFIDYISSNISDIDMSKYDR